MVRRTSSALPDRESWGPLPSPRLVVEPDRGCNEAIVFLRGEIDLASAGWLGDEIRRAEVLRPNRLVVDCHELDFIDAFGISTLVEAQQRAQREGRLLVLTRIPNHARRILDLTGLSAYFTLT